MKNRCFGCKYYEGFDGCIVRCDLGYKNISIKQGCSDFTPDNTAECQDCFYKKGMNEFWIIDCSIRGDMDGTQTYCSDYARREEDDCDKKGKGGCFVTTTVCDILGKDDQCFELKILRKFRDEVLLIDNDLRQLVFEYYNLSPVYVNKIINIENKRKFAQYLLDEHINCIIETIQDNDKYKAVFLYKNMLNKIDKIK